MAPPDSVAPKTCKGMKRIGKREDVYTGATGLF